MTSKTRKTTKRKKEISSRAEGLMASARDLAGQVGTVKDTALEAYRTVETMPKPQQRRVTTISLAVGALLFLLGAPRLLTFLAFLPAVAVSGARLAKRTR